MYLFTLSLNIIHFGTNSKIISPSLTKRRKLLATPRHSIFDTESPRPRGCYLLNTLFLVDKPAILISKCNYFKYFAHTTGLKFELLVIARNKVTKQSKEKMYYCSLILQNLEDKVDQALSECYKLSFRCHIKFEKKVY